MTKRDLRLLVRVSGLSQALGRRYRYSMGWSMVDQGFFCMDTVAALQRARAVQVQAARQAPPR